MKLKTRSEDDIVLRFGHVFVGSIFPPKMFMMFLNRFVMHVTVVLILTVDSSLMAMATSTAYATMSSLVFDASSRFDNLFLN